MANKKQAFVTVNCNLLNIRQKPTKDSAVIRQAGKGEQLAKLGTAGKGTWIKVPDGYVMTEFVS